MRLRLGVIRIFLSTLFRIFVSSVAESGGVLRESVLKNLII